jgi:hypothetical protein
MGKRMDKKNKMIRRAVVFVALATVDVLVWAIMKMIRSAAEILNFNYMLLQIYIVANKNNSHMWR